MPLFFRKFHAPPRSCSLSIVFVPEKFFRVVSVSAPSPLFLVLHFSLEGILVLVVIRPAVLFNEATRQFLYKATSLTLNTSIRI